MREAGSLWIDPKSLRRHESRNSFLDLKWVYDLTEAQNKQLLQGVSGAQGFYLPGLKYQGSAKPGIAGLTEGVLEFFDKDPLAVKWHAEDKSPGHQPYRNDFYDHVIHEFEDQPWSQPFVQAVKAIWDQGGSKQEQTARLFAYLKFITLLSEGAISDGMTLVEAENALAGFLDFYESRGMKYESEAPLDREMFRILERTAALKHFSDFSEFFEREWRKSQTPQENLPREVQWMVEEYDRLGSRPLGVRNAKAKKLQKANSLITLFGAPSDKKKMKAGEKEYSLRVNFGPILGKGRVYKDGVHPYGDHFFIHTFRSADQKHVLMLGHRKGDDFLWIYLPKSGVYKKVQANARHNFDPDALSKIPEIKVFQDAVVRSLYDDPEKTEEELRNFLSQEGYTRQPSHKGQIYYERQGFDLTLPLRIGEKADWVYLRVAHRTKPGVQLDLVAPGVTLENKATLLDAKGPDYYFFVPLTNSVAMYGRKGFIRTYSNGSVLTYKDIPELKRAFESIRGTRAENREISKLKLTADEIARTAKDRFRKHFPGSEAAPIFKFLFSRKFSDWARENVISPFVKAGLISKDPEEMNLAVMEFVEMTRTAILSDGVSLDMNLVKAAQGISAGQLDVFDRSIREDLKRFMKENAALLSDQTDLALRVGDQDTPLVQEALARLLQQIRSVLILFQEGKRPVSWKGFPATFKRFSAGRMKEVIQTAGRETRGIGLLATEGKASDYEHLTVASLFAPMESLPKNPALRRSVILAAASVLVALSLLKQPEEILENPDKFHVFLRQHFPRLAESFKLEKGAASADLGQMIAVIQSLAKAA